MTVFEPAPETSAVFLTVDATGGAPEELLARTVHTKKRMRLYRALTVGVCALCVLPLVTLFVAFDTTVLRYDWLFYAVLAGQLAAAAGVLVRLWSTCRAARRSTRWRTQSRSFYARRAERLYTKGTDTLQTDAM